MAGLNTRIKIDGAPTLWERVDRSAHSVILLDYDGTLAPFHEERMQARPLEGVVDALERIANLPDTTVALVSGRPVAEVQDLTGLNGVMIAGTHGFELYEPDAGTVSTELSPEIAETLDRAHQEAVRLVGPARAERKVATVALHVRGMDDRAAQAALDAFREHASAAPDDDFVVRAFNGGLELRVRHRDKGVAVGEILAATRPADLVIYIGDDDTDEDAFRELPPETGIGIRVGRADRPTHAAGRIDSCEDVLKFLTDWIATKTCQ
jgi:trehalose-phosphatase